MVWSGNVTPYMKRNIVEDISVIPHRIAIDGVFNILIGSQSDQHTYSWCFSRPAFIFLNDEFFC